MSAQYKTPLGADVGIGLLFFLFEMIPFFLCVCLKMYVVKIVPSLVKKK